mmetsp:Transcript_51599/g.144177  ORF Transcript_51599/g.144177 Transcript_51599/m.144177 type:complete len:206 (+) Transcript_51599:940-1557(+)
MRQLLSHLVDILLILFHIFPIVLRLGDRPSKAQLRPFLDGTEVAAERSSEGDLLNANGAGGTSITSIEHVRDVFLDTFLVPVVIDVHFWQVVNLDSEIRSSHCCSIPHALVGRDDSEVKQRDDKKEAQRAHEVQPTEVRREGYDVGCLAIHDDFALLLTIVDRSRYIAKVADGGPYSSCAAVWREIAGDVENQERQAQARHHGKA